MWELCLGDRLAVVGGGRDGFCHMGEGEILNEKNFSK
jgi:hypothetical protein